MAGNARVFRRSRQRLHFATGPLAAIAVAGYQATACGSTQGDQVHSDEPDIQTLRRLGSPQGHVHNRAIVAHGALLEWIIALVLIGHSVLMLGVAHGTTAPLRGFEHAHQTLHDDAIMAQGPVALAMANEHPAQHRSDRCDVVFPAAPRRDNGPPETITVALGTSLDTAAATIIAPILPADVLGQPPSVRRALLQVYRI
ncbi:MAG: hypothetical protein C4346_06895 [Chloroflexota bacterium]